MYPDHQRQFADGHQAGQPAGHPVRYPAGQPAGHPVGYQAGQPYGGQVYGSNAYANQYVNHSVQPTGTFPHSGAVERPGYGYQGGHEYYTHGQAPGTIAHGQFPQGAIPHHGGYAPSTISQGPYANHVGQYAPGTYNHAPLN